MQYVEFGKTGLKVSRFGLGCMRFPVRERDAIDMVRYAIDHGVNYIDTAHAYPDSERIVGKALENGYRKKTYIATKSPVWYINSYRDFEKYLDQELKSLRTDYVDFYLLHSLNQSYWKTVQRYDGLTFLDKMIEKGKIRHKAFSFHGSQNLFKEIVDASDWDMAQIQLNILDEYYQAGVEGLRCIADKNMAAVIMEPLRGGSIIDQQSSWVKTLIGNYPEKRSLVEWCFRWLYNMPEVSVVLSGTSNLEQLKDNIRIFDSAESNVLSTEDLYLIQQIKGAFEGKSSIKCTGCKYCMPCPQGVDIPEVFKLYNSVNLTDDLTDRCKYMDMTAAGNGAAQCIECGLCTTHCPQSIKIPEALKTADRFLNI